MSFFQSTKFIDETGTAYGVKHVNNKPRVSSMPYLFDIAEGNVTNHVEFEQFGYNGDIDGPVEDLWPAGGSYVYPAAEMQMEIVSSSVNDTAAGTGIQSVTLYYLDDAFAEKTEDITLDGTNVVATAATDIYRVLSLRAKTVGTGGSAAGTITLRHLSDTPIYATIETGFTRSRLGLWTVPASKILYITSMYGGCISTTANGATITLRAKYDHLAAATRTFFMPHAEVLVGSSSGGITRVFELPIKLPAGVDIKVSATSLANNASVSCSLRGWIETA